MPQGKLTNKVAIITGSAQGMGKAIAEMFVREGADVVVSDINGKKAQLVAESIDAMCIKMDVTNAKDVEIMVKKVVERFGAIDILVNNAGIMYPTRIDDLTKEEWDRVLDVNLNGTFLCTKVVLGIMKAKKYGRIVNISSSAGRSVSTLGGAHYTASKAAILGFTRAVAKEAAPLGITVNAVCPGLIDTEMVRQECSAERINTYETSFPIPRMGTPEEVAKLVLFLVADAPYITGASIDINGGDLMI
ncbi:MAG: SDR family NAD(P)-dependent oxidoreductase [Candidatus Hatepunaea meridiana]|nr:SDR family NAD(P)-dependent oxidoreductase [Candidatus Hatepunaea meridiana]